MVEDILQFWTDNLKKNYKFLSAIIGDFLSSITIIVFTGITYGWAWSTILVNLIVVTKSLFIIFITLVFKGEMITYDQIQKTLEANVKVAEARLDAKCQEVEIVKEYSDKLIIGLKLVKELGNLEK